MLPSSPILTVRLRCQILISGCFLFLCIFFLLSLLPRSLSIVVRFLPNPLLWPASTWLLVITASTWLVVWLLCSPWILLSKYELRWAVYSQCVISLLCPLGRNGQEVASMWLQSKIFPSTILLHMVLESYLVCSSYLWFSWSLYLNCFRGSLQFDPSQFLQHYFDVQVFFLDIYWTIM